MEKRVVNLDVDILEWALKYIWVEEMSSFINTVFKESFSFLNNGKT